MERYTQSFISARGLDARTFSKSIPVNSHWSIRLTGKPDGIIRCAQYTPEKSDESNDCNTNNDSVDPPLTPCSSSLRNAREKEEELIVEVKNRQSRIFKFVPLRELVQIQNYFYLTGLKKCLFVEKFGGEIWKTIIVRDDKMIEMIKTKLMEFADRCINTMIFESSKQLSTISA